MKQRLYILLSLALIIAACSHRPDGILSSGKMSAVLIDLHKTDGLINVSGYQYGHELEVAALYRSVLEKHGVSQADFDSSLVWYTDHPLQFNRIYPRVIEALEKEQALYSAKAEDALALQKEVRASQKGGWREWIRKAMEPEMPKLLEDRPEPMSIYHAPLMPGFTPYVLDTLSADSVYVPLRIQN